MPTFDISGDCKSLLRQLFTAEDSGHLRFGWTGLSVAQATVDDLLLGAVRFQDYIMEGFLVYRIEAHDISPGCRLAVTGEGSSRDWSILPQVRNYIRSVRAEIIDEAGD